MALLLIYKNYNFMIIVKDYYTIARQKHDVLADPVWDTLLLEHLKIRT